MKEPEDICKISGHCCCGFRTCCDCGEDIPVRLHTCQNCDKIAVWNYAPSDGTGRYCDLCVPRGCSCNVIDYDDEDSEQETDEQGRLLPCCEYEYDANGWDANLE